MLRRNGLGERGRDNKRESEQENERERERERTRESESEREQENAENERGELFDMQQHKNLSSNFLGKDDVREFVTKFCQKIHPGGCDASAHELSASVPKTKRPAVSLSAPYAAVDTAVIFCVGSPHFRVMEAPSLMTPPRLLFAATHPAKGPLGAGVGAAGPSFVIVTGA